MGSAWGACLVYYASNDGKGTRLPAAWVLPEESRQWAQINYSPDNDAITEEAERFKDYWISKPGAGGRKSDWQATWRNWCRSAKGASATTRRSASVTRLPDFQAQRDAEAAARQERSRKINEELLRKQAEKQRGGRAQAHPHDRGGLGEWLSAASTKRH
jgi:hypothetical protein